MTDLVLRPPKSSRLPVIVDDVQLTDAEFRIPASDQSGHSERNWFNLQPGHHREIEIIVFGRQFPYRTPGDLIRHAVIRHLKWLDGIAQAPIQSVMAQTDAVIRVMQEEKYQQDFDELFEDLDKTVARHVKDGRIDSATRLVGDVKNRFLDMPPGEWQDRYLDEVEKRYGHLK